MALTVISFLCFAALLPFLGLGGPEDCSALLPFLGLRGPEVCSGNQGLFSMKVSVTNKFAKMDITYSTTVKEGIPMFGVLNQLHKTNSSFNFTYTIDDNYGIFVNGVNGVNGSTETCTYWELLSQSGSSIEPLSVGIGCYLTKKNENFIMNFTTWHCPIYGYK